MTTLTDTQVVTASGGLVELASTVPTSDSATVSAGSNAVVIGPITAVCDGSPVLVEFQAARVDSGSSGGGVYFTLEIDGVSQGRIGEQSSGNLANTHHSETRVTPSAGSHTFQIRMYPYTSAAAFRAASATWAVGSTFLRVSKIVQATQWPAVTTGTIICTSTTRPASPFEGQTIYETDTDKTLIWNASNWVGISTPAALTTTQRGTLTPYTGLEIYNTTTGAWEVYNGSSWQISRPFAMASGASYGGVSPATVTFPTGRFTQTPRISLLGDGAWRYWWTALSTTGFTWDHDGNTNNTVTWIAVQMTSGSGDG
jgi:hypothetical protein